MDNLYLILHKVRGQPALDVATPCDDMGTPSDPGPWWIIPTSGHRAYPEHYLALDRLTTIDPQLEGFYQRLFDQPSASLRDHYEAAQPLPKPAARQTSTPSPDQLLDLIP